MTDFKSFASAPGAERLETELLPPREQQHQVSQENTGVSLKEAPARRHGVKTSPYARVERATTRRTKRLGPAFSLSTTRQIYPDEESTAGV